MEHTITKTFSNSGTRNEVRMRAITDFSNETPGQGNGDLASKYIYYVETLADGNRVCLTRPANLHNGFDFRISVEGVNFALGEGGHRNVPKQEDIIADLELKKQSSPTAYAALTPIIESVYDCQDVPESRYASLHFSVGLPVELIVKLLKWLFIEQDIRYWNYSGRAMLWDAIPK